MILRLPHRQPTRIPVPARPLEIRPLLARLLPARQRTLKQYDQLVLALLQDRGDVNPGRGEHIIRPQDLDAVQRGGGVRVEALKHQVRVSFVRGGGRLGKDDGVDPVLLAHPLNLCLVLVQERVRDHVVCEEVDKDLARHRGDRAELGDRIRCALEEPVLVEGCDGLGHC